MLESKDANTERFRRMLSNADGLLETDRADSGLTCLSYQSVAHSERHVWLDTDLDGESILDLEDWNCNDTWDNAVAYLTSDNLELLAAIAKAWLTGASLDACKSMGALEADAR